MTRIWNMAKLINILFQLFEMAYKKMAADNQQGSSDASSSDSEKKEKEDKN